MAKILPEEYAITFESYGPKSYLAIEVKNREGIVNYQLEMVRHNPGHGRAPIDIAERDGCCFLYYDVTSMLPLKYFIERRQFTKKMFIEVLVKITDAILDNGGYLLKIDGFLLEKEYIFLDSSTKCVSLLYLPVNKPLTGCNSIKSLTAELLADICDIDDGNEDSFADRILSFIRYDTFSLTEFGRLLNSMNQNPDKKGGEPKQCEIIAPVTFSEAIVSKPEEKKKPRLRWQIAVVVMIQVVIILAVISVPKLLNGLSGDVKANYTAVALIAGALDLLALKCLLKKRPAAVDSISNECINTDRVLEPKELEFELKPLNDQKACEEYDHPNNGSPRRSVSKTMVLKGETFDHPVLICSVEGDFEEIHITKNDFVIGRMAEQADYVSRNPAVGKLHARIVCREGNYYLTDLNSRNGTFVNGNRLNGCLEQQLKNGDRVTFANRDYTFAWR